MGKILIKNGRLATYDKLPVKDILIDGETIVDVGDIETEDGVQVVDASGYLVFPGFIDGHTHLDMDTGTTVTADDFYTGTRAAIKGGTTCIIDFATQSKGETLQQALDQWHQKAEQKSSCDYAFHMAITEWHEGVANEIETMKTQGVTSFKLYMAYDALRVSDEEIYTILKCIGRYGGVVSMHCENGDLVNVLTKELLSKGHCEPTYHPLARPEEVEAEAIGRFLDIAYLVDVPVHIVHLTGKEGLKRIRLARMRGQKVWVETCPQYLLLESTKYLLEGFESAKYVLSPPLRSTKDQEALWQAVASGEIGTISTDHCSFNYETQKILGKDDFSKIPNGIPGIEHRPQLIYTYGVDKGKVTPKQMSELLSTNVAKLFGMYPKKGAIEVGSDADIVLWNPMVEEKISVDNQLHNVDYTPYEGMRVKGRVEYVYLRGQLVVAEGSVVQEKLGVYTPRKSKW